MKQLGDTYWPFLNFEFLIKKGEPKGLKPHEYILAILLQQFDMRFKNFKELESQF